MHAIIIGSLICGLSPGGADPSGPANLRCGSYCLYVALRALDVSVPDYAAFESKLGQPGRLGYSMQELAAAAHAYGAHAIGVETSLENLSRRRGRFACIALLERGHFVNLYDVDDDRVYLVDPPVQRTVASGAFRAIWTKKALLVSDREIIAEADITWARSGWLVLKYFLILTPLAFLVIMGARHVRRPAS